MIHRRWQWCAAAVAEGCAAPQISRRLPLLQQQRLRAGRCGGTAAAAVAVAAAATRAVEV